MFAGEQSVHACQRNMHKAQRETGDQCWKNEISGLKNERKRITDTHTYMEHGARELRAIMDEIDLLKAWVFF